MRDQLPFPEDERTRYARQEFCCFDVLLLALQGEICRKWLVTVAEAAQIVRQAAPGLLVEWTTLARDAWLVRERRQKNTFAVWLTNRTGILELLRQGEEDQPPFEWSTEALEIQRALLAAGASPTEAQRAVMKIDGERATAWHQETPQSLWVLSVTGVLLGVRETARQERIELPAFEDRDAWLAAPGSESA